MKRKCPQITICGLPWLCA